jgi:8-hydroxy-5-deazaflavin:NADPH oxidoreductase
MNITVIGSGNIGGTLGRRWAEAGHSVIFGVRDLQSPKARAALAAAGPTAQMATIGDALVSAEVVLLALPGAAINDFAVQYGALLQGRVVLDASNQFGQPVINGLAPLRAAAPNAQFVRAFNGLGWENFADPVRGGQQVDLFFCADAAARSTAETLISGIGLRPIFVGDLNQVSLVDNLGALWVRMAFAGGLGRKIAFKLLTEA